MFAQSGARGRICRPHLVLHLVADDIDLRLGLSLIGPRSRQPVLARKSIEQIPGQVQPRVPGLLIWRIFSGSRTLCRVAVGEAGVAAEAERGQVCGLGNLDLCSGSAKLGNLSHKVGALRQGAIDRRLDRVAQVLGDRQVANAFHLELAGRRDTQRVGQVSMGDLRRSDGGLKIVVRLRCGAARFEHIGQGSQPLLQPRLGGLLVGLRVV